MTLLTFALVVFSAILHAGWNVITKRFSGNYSLIYLSFCAGLLVSLPLAWPHLSAPTDWAFMLPLLLLTGVLHGIYGLLLSFTYHNGDISTLYPIVRGSGIAGSVLLGILLLGEHLPWQAYGGVATVIGGIALLSYRRDRRATPVKGIALALVSGAFIMSYTILDKMIVDRIHPMVLMAAMQLVSAVMFLPYVLLKRRKELRLTVGTLKIPVLGISIFALASYLIILFAFQLAPISRIVAVREVSVVLGAMTGYLFFKESFSLVRLLGVATVVFGIVLVKLF
ncbi:MAG: EamA family transporter [Flavobacteriales bacterium]|nr:EamA family transporter [Flavobacteriales bacterium]